MEVASEANGLDVIQSMIDISADRLEGLRTQCATSASLTQQEIRSLETKLVRMFSELLLTKARLPERIPSSGLAASGAELRQWLRVVGLSQDSLNICLQRLNTLEQLLEMSESELREMLSSNTNLRDEEHRRLSCAILNLRKCRDALREGSKEPDSLYWDSWDRHHHAHHHRNLNNVGGFASPRNNRPGVKQIHKARQSPISGSGEQLVQSPSAITTPEDGMHTSTHTLTPSPSPPNSPCLNNLSSSSGNNNSNQKVMHRKSGTPPPKKIHQTGLPYHSSTPSHTPSSQSAASMTGSGNNINQDPMAPLTKSKSHELQLTQDNGQQPAANNNSNNNVQQKSQSTAQTTTYTHHPIPRTRLHTEPGPDLPSQIHYPYNAEIVVENTNNLTVPRSPCTPIVSLGMGHQITHRFTKVFKVMSTCDLCQKQMFFGLKCKECKYRCHKDCEPNVPPSCGLPREFVDEFKRTLQSGDVFMPNTSPNLGTRSGYLTAGRMTKNPMPAYHAPDSSSPGSSCNSSSPSSPALFNALHHQHTQQHAVSQLTTPSSAHKTSSQFNFPEVSASSAHHPAHVHVMHHSKLASGVLESPLTTSSTPNSSSATISSNHFQSKAGGKLHQYSMNNNAMAPPLSDLVDTHRSNDSDKTVSLSGSTSASTDSDRTPVRLDSTEEGDSGNWPRQNSLSLKEWDIPYGDLKLLEEIGKGRFGTVHRALWHGDVAVKLLKEDYLNDAQTLDAFKLEVATFKKTRHENLVLFMGACMNPPFLAIVTSLCKGNTLYTYIHIRRDKFNLNRSTLVAQQISQGMGYLHARGIFHKDLRTKNIFLENGKVIITDFGLFSSTKLMYCDLGLCIPNGWLCYLSPELIRTLSPFRPIGEILPFSKASDVYAFGTVWYELLCGEFPFKMQASESIIWQVGRGMKQTLANLQTSRDVKDILMLCWSFQADDRPPFSRLLTLLERLPKKRLARSPSHPVQLSRSAESVF